MLAHELAHIRRSDWVIQIASELLRIVYWFNPLMWLASARLRLESERACDDAVVNLGVSGRDYATHLLEVARQFGGARHSAFPAVAIAPRPSTLERRVSAMLNTRLSRGPVSGPARLAHAGGAARRRAAGRALRAERLRHALRLDHGSIGWPSARRVSWLPPDLDRRVRHEVHTDGAGRFELVGLPQGEYTLEAGLPGFETFQQKLTLSGEDVLATSRWASDRSRRRSSSETPAQNEPSAAPNVHRARRTLVRPAAPQPGTATKCKRRPLRFGLAGRFASR